MEKKTLSLLDIYTAYAEENYRLAEKISRGGRSGCSISMLLDQAFGAVDGIIRLLNYQRDPDNLVPALRKMWDEYLEKFNQLLEK